MGFRSILKASLAVWLVYVLFYIGRYNYAALIPVIRDAHGFTNTELGIIASAMFFIYAIFQTPSGFLADRLGIRLTLFLGCILISLGNLLMLSWFFPLLILAQFINGAGQSTGWSSLTKYASYSRESSKIMGVLSSAVPAGTFLAYLFAANIAERFGENYAFVFPSLLLFLLGLGILRWIHPDSTGVSPFNTSILINRNIFLLSVVQFSILSTMNGSFLWLPAVFVDVYGIENYEATKLASLIPLTGIVSGVAGGIASSRIDERRIILLNQIVLATVFLLLVSIRSFPLFYLSFLLASIFFRFGSAALFTLAVNTAGNEYAGTVSGYLNFVGSVGSIISSGLGGLIVDNLGFDYLFILFSSISTLSVFSILLFRNSDGVRRD